MSKKTNAEKLKRRAGGHKRARRGANPLKGFTPNPSNPMGLGGFGPMLLDFAVDQMLLSVLRTSGIRDMVKNALAGGGGIEIVTEGGGLDLDLEANGAD